MKAFESTPSAAGDAGARRDPGTCTQGRRILGQNRGSRGQPGRLQESAKAAIRRLRRRSCPSPWAGMLRDHPVVRERGVDHAGDAVYALLDWNLGGYAEFVCVSAALCAPKPASLSIAEAGAVPLAALTAWQGISTTENWRLGRPSSSMRFGWGRPFAVQFARNKGARVIATASGKNMDFVRQLGADTVIDYKAERFEDAAVKVDVVFDLIGGETRERSWARFAPADPRVDPGSAGRVQGAAIWRPIQGLYGGAQSRPVDRDRPFDRRKKGPAIITRSYPLQAARDAQRFLEHEHPRGKVVLTTARAKTRAFMSRVLIVDSHAVARAGYRQLLERNLPWISARPRANPAC